MFTFEARLLDHGYVRYIEHWGSDERIIEAARMSTQKGFLGWGPFHADDCRSYSGRKTITTCGCTAKPGDEKLLRHLWENDHSTPFEMAGLVVEVQGPIMVFREWHRHRTQCLAGDAKIICVSPRGTTYTRTIQQIYELKCGVVDHIRPGDPLPPGFTKNGYSKNGTPVLRHRRLKHQTGEGIRIRVMPNCQSRTLRVCVEETGEFTTASMVDVWETGVKDIFCLDTVRGFSVRASAEHPFLTDNGWVKMKDVRAGDRVARMGKVAAQERPIPPSLRQGIGVWTTMMRSRLLRDRDWCYLCEKEFAARHLTLDHVIPVSECLRLALDEKNLKPACLSCHRKKTDTEQPSRIGMSRRGVRWERVKETPILVGEEMTYDLEVNGAHHNYVANELVVHNSYNEMSARYTPLPDVNYVPFLDRLLSGGDGKNKQAGTVAGVPPLTEAQALQFQKALAQSYADTESIYQESLRAGVPKELARLVLPVGRYSKMRAQALLLNWCRFLGKRAHPKAQYEIRVYAEAILDLLRKLFPRTMELFDERNR